MDIDIGSTLYKFLNYLDTIFSDSDGEGSLSFGCDNVRIASFWEYKLDRLQVHAKSSSHKQSVFSIFGDGLVDELWIFVKNFLNFGVLFAIDMIVEVLLFGVDKLVCIAHLNF